MIKKLDQNLSSLCLFTVSIVRFELRNEKNLFLFTPKKQNQERGTVPSYGF